MYDIVGKRNLWFAISALLTIPGLIFIFLGGLRPSIDFTGGTEWEVRYAETPTAAEVASFLTDANYDDVVVTELADGFLRIRTEPIDLIPPGGLDPEPSGSLAPSASASADATASGDPSPSASADATASGDPSPPASADASAEASPSASASAEPTGSAEPTPAPIAGGTEFANLED